MKAKRMFGIILFSINIGIGCGMIEFGKQLNLSSLTVLSYAWVFCWVFILWQVLRNETVLNPKLVVIRTKQRLTISDKETDNILKKNGIRFTSEGSPFIDNPKK
jgi:hypothetical protein